MHPGVLFPVTVELALLVQSLLVFGDQRDSWEVAEELVGIRVRGVSWSWGQGVVQVIHGRGWKLESVFGSGSLEGHSLVGNVADGLGHGAECWW